MIKPKLILSYHILAPLHFFFLGNSHGSFLVFFSFGLYLFQYLSLGTLKKMQPIIQLGKNATQFHYHTQE